MSEWVGIGLNKELKSFTLYLFPVYFTTFLSESSIYIKLTIISLSFHLQIDIDDEYTWG